MRQATARVATIARFMSLPLIYTPPSAEIQRPQKFRRMFQRSYHMCQTPRARRSGQERAVRYAAASTQSCRSRELLDAGSVAWHAEATGDARLAQTTPPNAARPRRRLASAPSLREGAATAADGRCRHVSVRERLTGVYCQVFGMGDAFAKAPAQAHEDEDALPENVAPAQIVHLIMIGAGEAASRYVVLAFRGIQYHNSRYVVPVFKGI